MKRNILIGLLVVSLLSTIVFGVGAAEITTLKWASGGMGGDLFLVAAGIANLVYEKDNTIKLDVVPGAGLANCARVGTKEADMMMNTGPSSKSAFGGFDPFTEAYPDIRGACNGFGFDIGQLLVTKDTGLETIDDLINQKYPVNLVVEPIGSSDPLFLSRILKFYGADFDTIIEWGGSVKFMGYDDQTVYFKDKHANLAFQNGAAPAPSLQEIAFSRPDLRLLKFSSDELRKYLAEEFAYTDYVIKKSAYEFMEEDVITCAAILGLYFNKDVPEDVVYRIIKIICENAEGIRSISTSQTNFNPGPASSTGLGAPLHPGAERYYKEVGWIK